jgi:prepilin-type N-terminal cleavage/methylation domain-containing protein
LFKVKSNEQGVTLVELLASIVILSIILVSFITFFTNSFQFNRISSDNLIATNLARETQEEFKNNDLIKQDVKKLITNKNDSSYLAKDKYSNLKLVENIVSVNSGKNFQLNLINPNYKVLVIVSKDPDPTLHTVHVKVYDNLKLLSETYTYIKL